MYILRCQDKVLMRDPHSVTLGKKMPKRERMTTEAAERIARTSKDTKFIERAREAAEKRE